MSSANAEPVRKTALGVNKNSSLCGLTVLCQYMCIMSVYCNIGRTVVIRPRVMNVHCNYVAVCVLLSIAVVSGAWTKRPSLECPSNVSTPMKRPPNRSLSTHVSVCRGLSMVITPNKRGINPWVSVYNIYNMYTTFRT